MYVAAVMGLFALGVNTLPEEKKMSTVAPTHKHTNKLIDETSPYLLQHAHNPVDWYPWGAEAFERRKRTNLFSFPSAIRRAIGVT